MDPGNVMICYVMLCYVMLLVEFLIGQSYIMAVYSIRAWLIFVTLNHSNVMAIPGSEKSLRISAYCDAVFKRRTSKIRGFVV
jgi:hypothetical protein